VSKTQGWYRDPFGLHEDRYFTEGFATKLVRDGGRESYDLPPDLPVFEEELIPIRKGKVGAVLRRRSRARDYGGGSAEFSEAGQAVFDYFRRHWPL
jgi:hypothetical protein